MAVVDAPFLAGALAYIIITCNGGYLWHLLLFKDQYSSLEAWTRFEEPVIPLSVAAIFLQALLVSYMLPHFLRATGASGPLGGARFGSWVAGFMISVAVFAHSAKNRMTCVEGFAVIEGLYCLLQFPLACAFVAFAQEKAHRAPPRVRRE